MMGRRAEVTDSAGLTRSQSDRLRLRVARGHPWATLQYYMAARSSQTRWARGMNAEHCGRAGAKPSRLGRSRGSNEARSKAQEYTLVYYNYIFYELSLVL